MKTPIIPKFRALEFLLGRSTSSSELCPPDFEVKTFLEQFRNRFVVTRAQLHLHSKIVDKMIFIEPSVYDGNDSPF